MLKKKVLLTIVLCLLSVSNCDGASECQITCEGDLMVLFENGKYVLLKIF